MARNEEGEFEMVLGNKQLLSIFFIAVILAALCFIMGYLMGRSTAGGPMTAKSLTQDASNGPKPDAVSPAIDTAPAQTATTGGSDQPQNPATTTPAAEPPAQAPAQEPPATKPAEPAPSSPEPTGPGPQPGQVYLQVAATSRAEAELETDVLKKRGFPAILAPVPNSAMFRVLVGPMKDSTHIARTKLDLEAKGFKSAIVRKY